MSSTLLWPGDKDAWRKSARCAEVDPELFVPGKGSTRQAKLICRGCEVRAECLQDAFANGREHGVWGGLSEQERRKLKRERKAA